MNCQSFLMKHVIFNTKTIFICLLACKKDNVLHSKNVKRKNKKNAQWQNKAEQSKHRVVDLNSYCVKSQKMNVYLLRVAVFLF